eukprot:14333556-Alexandrium_andersonii.AAC.1
MAWHEGQFEARMPPQMTAGPDMPLCWRQHPERTCRLGPPHHMPRKRVPTPCAASCMHGTTGEASPPACA